MAARPAPGSLRVLLPSQQSHDMGLGTRVIWGSPGAKPHPRLAPHTPRSSRCGRHRARVRRLTASSGVLPPLFSKISLWASPQGVAKYSCVYLYKCTAKERPHLFSLADVGLKAVFCRPSFSPAVGDCNPRLLAASTAGSWAPWERIHPGESLLGTSVCLCSAVRERLRVCVHTCDTSPLGRSVSVCFCARRKAAAPCGKIQGLHGQHTLPARRGSAGWSFQIRQAGHGQLGCRADGFLHVSRHARSTLQCTEPSHRLLTSSSKAEAHELREKL